MRSYIKKGGTDMHINTQGLVLRETNYKDGDKILTVLTSTEGKRTVKARGCRRKNSPLAASAQLLVYSEMSLFAYRDRWSMNEANTLEEFRGLRADMALLALASYCAETLDAVAREGEETSGLLPLILNTLYALDKLHKPQRLVKAVYELKLLALSGYAPLLDACAVCGTPEPAAPALHLVEGVLHCAACGKALGSPSLPLRDGALAAMRHVLYGDPKRLFSFRLGEAGMAQMSRACEAFLRTQLERSFHTLDFYKGLLQPPIIPNQGES